VTLSVVSLFSGIGGLDRGLELAGLRVTHQAETDPFCSLVLARHWPDVPNLGDVTSIDWSTVGGCDVVAAGFPCQDASDAGRRAGIDGEQTGLWVEVARCVRDLRPRFVVLENVTGLLARGFGRVVGDLAALGYDAEWDCVPAAAVGAAHLRARTWVLAYPCGKRGEADDPVQAGWPQPELRAWWDTEPAVDRVADGVPRRLVGAIHQQNRALGNAVVPQVAELVGRLILERAA
jgi:DNA (cytosine-5)-methyltransferase 1